MVITIIAVLAGLLLPVVQKVLQNAKKVTAKTAETQIVAAVNAFQTEYGQYPVVTSANSTTTTTTTAAKDTTYGIDANHNNLLFNVLRNLEGSSGTVYNTRHIVYFESKNVKNVSSPIDGFVPANNTGPGNSNASPIITMQAGDFVDPWGNMYGVRLDSGYSNGVLNPYSQSASSLKVDDDDANVSSRTDPSIILTGVISWSPGNDGTLNTVTTPFTPTPGDDVVSWQ